jgi:hypothetical protein
MKLSKRALWGMITGIGAAILVLMLFSLDRTAWALSIYETGRTWQHERALAGSIVIELAVIACIIARSVNAAEVRRLAWTGLVLFLSVQTLANLWGGWVYGWNSSRTTMPDSRTSFAVAVAGWALINALIPVGIFILSEIEALLVRYLIAVYAEGRTAAPAEDPHPVAAPAPVHQPAPSEPRPVAPAPTHRTGVLKLDRTKAQTWDRIIAGLSAGEPLAAIGGALGISEAMVRKHRDAMVREGVLVREGRDYSKNGVALEAI